MSRRLVRFVIAAGGGIIAVSGVSWSAASGAGFGYGGPSAVPQGVPGGFSHVVTVKTVPASGGRVAVQESGVHMIVNVPAGAPQQVAITNANAIGSISPAAFTALPPRVRHERPVFGAAVVVTTHGKAARDHGLVVVTLRKASFSRSDYVVMYSSARQGFIPMPKGFARVLDGVATLKFHITTEFMILGRSS